jgi:hypothetical protein
MPRISRLQGTVVITLRVMIRHTQGRAAATPSGLAAGAVPITL